MILSTIAAFFAGAFLCNCIPHLCAGLRGEPFPTPFAKPPGVGKSSARTNFLWGTGNLVVGCLLFARSDVFFGLDLPTLVFFVGFLAGGYWVSAHFEKVRGK
jgi:hypothetical protein